MKKLLFIAATVTLLSVAQTTFAQAPTLGTAANYVLFSTNGAVSNSGVMSHLTGNIGTNNGSSTGFGNVDGVMHDQDGNSAQAAADLLTVYNQINNTTTTTNLAPAMGGGQTLTSGVYNIASATSLNGSLTFDALGSTNAVFIVKIQGSFSANTGAKIKLANGALACNVFFNVDGQVIIATGVVMRGTIIANNAAISLAVGDTLEGRALSTTGAVTVSGILAYLPLGCGSAVLTGPTAPTLGGTACYALFTSNGAVTNSGVTHISGDIGSNSGSATGYNPAFVSGTIHTSPDGSTAQCALDLANVYSYINSLSADIELLYPAQFGNNLVLTPHTYVMNGATTFTDTLYLNAQGNANAVFVIQINGALNTSTYAKVNLINGAQSKNVFWKVEGNVGINNYSIFRGTIICNNGAMSALNTGVTFDGRALTTAGALTTASVNAVATTLPVNCATLDISSIALNKTAKLYPNPFTNTITIEINDNRELNNGELKIYNLLGDEVMHAAVTKQALTLNTGELPAGVYFYKIFVADKTIQAGRLIAQ